MFQGPIFIFQWFSSQDPQGKIYYYEENSSKSSWFLPVPGITLNEENSVSLYFITI